jgi:ABC-type polysaccharide/polyol phosphate export permease
MKSRYSGSAFGAIWAYVQPLVTIMVFWFVFQLGFKNSPVENVEYILWFIAADIPWVYFNDGLLSTSNVFYEYSYLVKKMKFQVWLLPIVKVLSSLCIHSFFIVFIIGMYLLYGYSFQLAWISVLYYSFCITILLIGLAYLVSALSVFLKDNTQIINIVLQLGFWMTPIFWSETSMNENILVILQKNPLYYIVTGYRDALINGIGFWKQPITSTLYFWCVTLVILALGVRVYVKLRDHFADLL